MGFKCEDIRIELKVRGGGFRMIGPKVACMFLYHTYFRFFIFFLYIDAH